MTRYVTPILFAAVTAYIAWYNDAHTDRKLLVPFVDVIFPDLARDPAALGERSVYVAAAITILVTVWTVVGHVRAIRRRRAEAEED